MEVVYKNGMKIITHPTGVVRKYSVADLKKGQDRIHERLSRLNEQLGDLSIEIAEVENTLESKNGEKNLPA